MNIKNYVDNQNPMAHTQTHIHTGRGVEKRERECYFIYIKFKNSQK